MVFNVYLQSICGNSSSYDVLAKSSSRKRVTINKSTNVEAGVTRLAPNLIRAASQALNNKPREHNVSACNENAASSEVGQQVSQRFLL